MCRSDRGPVALAAAAAVALLLLGGCRQDMHDQPRYEPLEESGFYDDGRSSREPVEGTVPRGGLRTDELLYTGKTGGEPADSLPFPLTMELLERGRERFDIFCSPCHDRLGTGQGMVVRRGFPPAASLHIERLRQQRLGYFFDVISNGFGRMPSYAEQIPVRDRWAIVAYVRALQLSQAADLEDVPAGERQSLLAQRDGP